MPDPDYRRASLQGWAKPMQLRSTTVWGHIRLRILAALRRFRRASWRFAEEQQSIENWLATIAGAAALDTALAIEVAECARLIKGYGDTHRRGTQRFDLIAQTLIAPALNSETDPPIAATRIAEARTAALADPEGGALTEMLAVPLEKAAE